MPAFTFCFSSSESSGLSVQRIMCLTITLKLLIDYAAKISKIICMAKKNDENIVDFEEF
jgi:uncharacterized membrane protein